MDDALIKFPTDPKTGVNTTYNLDGRPYVEVSAGISNIFKISPRSEKDWWIFREDMPDPFNKNWDKSFEPWLGLTDGRLKNSIIEKIKQILQKIDKIDL